MSLLFHAIFMLAFISAISLSSGDAGLLLFDDEQAANNERKATESIVSFDILFF